MSLAQIEYFVAVSETGHVGRAAEALRIAQPAVSRQIRNLEDELGARLFVRSARGMRLSEAGDVFLEHARAILAQIDDARRAVQARKGPGGER
jgi:DNA-binding transcriptional LysR family regulator